MTGGNGPEERTTLQALAKYAVDSGHVGIKLNSKTYRPLMPWSKLLVLTRAPPKTIEKVFLCPRSRTITWGGDIAEEEGLQSEITADARLIHAKIITNTQQL